MASMVFGVLLGCGAKTGLSEDGRDAAVDPPAEAVGADAPRRGAIPRATCSPFSSEPEVLMENELLRPTALQVRGDRLLFGAEDRRAWSETPGGGIHAMPIAGGAVVRQVLSQPTFGTSFIATDAALIYRLLEATPSGSGWSYTFPGIAVDDPRGSRVLPTALEPRGIVFPVMAVLRDRWLVWGRRGPPGLGDVGLLDLETGLESTVWEEVALRVAVSGESVVYLYSRDRDERGGLAAFGDDGLTEVLTCDAFWDCRLLVAEGNEVYVARDNRVDAISVDGSSRTVFEFDTEPGPFAIDDRFLYWAEGPGIFFVDKRGGEPQLLFDQGRAIVLSIASDGCGVYWSTSIPSRIYVRSVP